MSSAAQLAANRANALYSTGPRTAAGKARSSRNACRHGLFAADPVVPLLGESAADWDAVRAGVCAAVRPNGAFERLLADRLAAVAWRLRRVARYADRAEAAALAAAAGLAVDPSDAAGGCGRDPASLRRTVAELADARRQVDEWAVVVAVAGRLAAGAADAGRVIDEKVANRLLAYATRHPSAVCDRVAGPVAEGDLGRHVRDRLAAAGLDADRAIRGLPDQLAGPHAAAADRARGLERFLLAAVADRASGLHPGGPAADLLDRLAGYERHLTAQLDAGLRQLAAARGLRGPGAADLRRRVTVVAAG